MSLVQFVQARPPEITGVPNTDSLARLTQVSDIVTRTAHGVGWKYTGPVIKLW